MTGTLIDLRLSAAFIGREAARWVIRQDLNHPSATDGALEAWLAADIRHRLAFLRISTAWSRVGKLRCLALAGEAPDPDLLERFAR